MAGANMAAPISVRLRQEGKMAAPISVRDVIRRRRATMLEALGGGGLLLVRDNAESEGRSVLRALVSEAVSRAQQVLVVLLEVPREQFQVGLSPSVRDRLQFRDVFGDPLRWLGGGSPPPRGVSWGGCPPPLPTPPVLVLDSLSWALLRQPLPHLCRQLGALLGAGRPDEPPPQILALLHQDLHPPGVLGALGALAKAQLILGGPPQTPGAPRGLQLLRDPKTRGGPLQEFFSLLPDGSLGPPLPQPPPKSPGTPQNLPKSPNLGVAPLTFRLGLSGAERGARAALTPPYLPRNDPEPPPEDPEDPDEDLDL